MTYFNFMEPTTDGPFHLLAADIQYISTALICLQYYEDGA